MSKIYLIVSGNIQDEKKVSEYKEVAGPVMKKYGGVMPPESFQVNQVLVGELKPSFLLRVEFPDVASINKAFADSDYLSVVKSRDEGFGDLSIFILQ